LLNSREICFSKDWHLEKTYEQQDCQHHRVSTSFPMQIFHEAVHFEVIFKIFKKDLRASKKEMPETQSVEAHNTRIKEHCEDDG
jgi:hypothetical protein